MEASTALTTAGAIGLTVAGGVSALFLTVNQGVVAEPSDETTPVVTEYVDQYGNPLPVSDPGAPIVVPAPAVAAAPADEYALSYDEEHDEAEEAEYGEEAEHAEGEQAEYEEDEEYEEYEEYEEAEAEEYGEYGEEDD